MPPVATDAAETIRGAIRARRTIVASHDGRRRIMRPHALGTTGGERRVLVLQVGGERSRPLPSGGDWRCPRLDRLGAIAVGAERWRPAADVSPERQRRIDEIDLAVA